MKCPKCGALNADSAKFCGLCHEAFSLPNSNIVPQEPPEQKQNLKQLTGEKDEPSQDSISEWLYPAILSTVIALLFTLILPMDQIGISLSLGKILLASVVLGSVVSSAGAIKANFKLALTGWFLGLSSSFLAFNLMFFSSFLLFRINPNLINSVAKGGIVIIAASISLAVAFYLALENIGRLKTLVVATSVFFFGLFLSLIIFVFRLNPLPVCVFLSWPAAFYLIKFLKSAKLSKQT